MCQRSGPHNELQETTMPLDLEQHLQVLPLGGGSIDTRPTKDDRDVSWGGSEEETGSKGVLETPPEAASDSAGEIKKENNDVSPSDEVNFVDSGFGGGTKAVRPTTAPVDLFFEHKGGREGGASSETPRLLVGKNGDNGSTDTPVDSSDGQMPPARPAKPRTATTMSRQQQHARHKSKFLKIDERRHKMLQFLTDGTGDVSAAVVGVKAGTFAPVDIQYSSPEEVAVWGARTTSAAGRGALEGYRRDGKGRGAGGRGGHRGNSGAESSLSDFKVQWWCL